MTRKVLTAVLTVLICLLAAGPVHDGRAETVVADAAEYFAQPEGYSYPVDLPNMMQMRYYAQNDPLWNRIVYEAKGSAKYRPFGDGGCCPTSLAIALMRLVPAEQLPIIGEYAKTPYSFCPHSINEFFCSERCDRFVPTTAEDYERLLPLVLADFAMGNNIYNKIGRTEDKGTDIGYMRYVAKIYGLQLSTRHTYEEALAALAEDAVVIAYCYKGSAFTNGGHYVTLVHADDEYVYVLDPYRRETYETENSEILHIYDPGVVTVRHEDIRYAKFENLIIIRNPLQKQPAMRYRPRMAK